MIQEESKIVDLQFYYMNINKRFLKSLSFFRGKLFAIVNNVNIKLIK